MKKFELSRALLYLILATVFLVVVYLKTCCSTPNVKTVKLATIPSREPVHIIFNTIPKSASVYIAHTLQVGLNCEQIKISPGYFPHDNILYTDIDRFYKMPFVIAKSHMDASLFNQQLLKKYTNRIVVQVRDPREVLLSWVHYLQRIHDENKIEYLYHVAPTPPAEYYSWGISAQIDWNIEHFTTEIVSWIESWIKFKTREDAKNNGFKVLITTYDDFKHDPLCFYNKLLNFYEIPLSQFTYTRQPLDMRLHYRKADQNEWREVFSDKQKARILQIVPASMLSSFKWEK